MRHRWSGRKLGRSSPHRRALLRTMVTEFLENERIVTTLAKAKEVRPVAEKMITLGKRESLHARRQALSYIRSKAVVHKLFDELAPRFSERPGGYTRILKVGPRRGDSADLAILELVTEDYAPSEKPKKKKKKAAAKPKPKPEPEEVEAPVSEPEEAPEEPQEEPEEEKQEEKEEVVQAKAEKKPKKAAKKKEDVSSKEKESG